MPSNATTITAVDAARSAFRSAAITFATSTTPPLLATLAAAKAAVALPGAPVNAGAGFVVLTEPVLPLFANDADAAFYRHLKVYVDRLIAAGAYAGPALPIP